MAAKPQVPETIREEPPVQGAPLSNLCVLGREKNLPQPILSGICASEGWSADKQITEAEFDAAVKRFLGTALNGRTPKAKEGGKA